MSTIPLVINDTMKYGDWLFQAEDGTESLRDHCAAGILDHEVFYQVGELPERMQASLMRALRAGDTEANDREVGRIMRAAFNRAVNEALGMYISRLAAESMMEARDD